MVFYSYGLCKPTCDSHCAYILYHVLLVHKYIVTWLNHILFVLYIYLYGSTCVYNINMSIHGAPNRFNQTQSNNQKK